MTTTTIPVRARGHKLIAKVVNLAFVGVIATASAIALTHDEPQSTSTQSRPGTATHVAVPMSPDAAERWLATDFVNLRGMTPDAAEHWLDPEPLNARGMSPDAAEHWLADK